MKWNRQTASTLITATAALILLAALPSAIRDTLESGRIYLFSQEFLTDLPLRFSGPGRLRFIIQPQRYRGCPRCPPALPLRPVARPRPAPGPVAQRAPCRARPNRDGHRPRRHRPSVNLRRNPSRRGTCDRPGPDLHSLCAGTRAEQPGYPLPRTAPLTLSPFSLCTVHGEGTPPQTDTQARSDGGATLNTSASVVIPAATFIAPEMRSGFIPSR